MLLGILIAIGIAALLGFPILYVLTLGALCMAGVAFALTRNEGCVAGFLGVVLAQLIPYYVFEIADPHQFPHWSLTIISALPYAASIVVTVLCALIGIAGRGDSSGCIHDKTIGAPHDR
jgi:hypothetical protein